MDMTETTIPTVDIIIVLLSLKPHPSQLYSSDVDSFEYLYPS